MKIRSLAAILGSAAAAASVSAYLKYRRGIAERRAALASGGRIAETSAGSIEYAEEGRGEPLLVIHGAGGGYDQGLLIARDFSQDFRLIAPSRFGYLRTPVPDDASPGAQADAHAALLDALGVQKCIILGASAGAPSAVEFALRYPERTRALILLVPRTYDPTQSIGPDDRFDSRLVLKIIEGSADFLFWIGMTVARPAIVRFLGVPPELDRDGSPKDRDRITDIMRSIFPLSERVRGIAVDSSTELSPWPLERVTAPTLIISAKDDLFETLPGARFTAAAIPGAELKILERGGHLMLGQGEKVRTWILAFLKRGATKVSRSEQGAARELLPV